MQIIMLGTGPFAVPTLRCLHASPHDVVCVVTRPPRGRRGDPPAPMRVAADELGLERTNLHKKINQYNLARNG